jgi:hypothetical protein
MGFRPSWKRTAIVLPPVALIIGLTLALTGAFAAVTDPELQHGISFTKGCKSPTAIGSGDSCAYSIFNDHDEAHDTLTISGLKDIVHAAFGKEEKTENLFTLATTKLDNCEEASGPCTQSKAKCEAKSGLTGTGTRADPWQHVEKCTLPFGEKHESRINVESSAQYTIKITDFENLPKEKGEAVLADTGELTWNDLCDGTPTSNCTENPPPNTGAVSKVLLEPIRSTTTTTIHVGEPPVTAVPVGSTVHDLVTVTGEAMPGIPMQPAPEGNVNVEWFENGKCEGTAAKKLEPPGALVPGIGLVSTFSGFAQGPLPAGEFSYKANYEGGGPYAPSVGACEPLKVVDANIQITPEKATNPVGAKHKLTCHINVNDGTGFVNAPDKTPCTVKVISGAATPASQTCETGPPTAASGSGSCVVEITSSTPGTNTIQAETEVEVGGVKLIRKTGDKLPGDSPNAEKTFVDANIQITPEKATNPVGAPHTLHCHINVNDGTGFVPAPDGTVCTVTVISGAAEPKTQSCKTGEPVPPQTPGNGTCDVVITSKTPGTNTIQAETEVEVGGVKLIRKTGDKLPGDSPNAEKTFESPFAPALTPGFWKNHEKATTALLPITLGNYKVSTFAQALAVFQAMKCSSPIDCLAAHELAAKLDVKNGSNPSIEPVDAEADALLIAVKYNGPGKFTLSAEPKEREEQLKLALKLEEKIDAFTNA